MGFRDLQRFESQRSRFDAYKAWQALTPDAKQAAYAGVTTEANRAKTERVAAYVSPFNTQGTTMAYLSARVIGATQTGAGSDVANALRTTLAAYVHGVPGGTALPANSLTIAAKRYPFAKLAFKSTSAITVKSTSRITKTQYNKPDVDTVTCAFGQATAGQDYDAAVADIRDSAPYKAFVALNGGKNRAKFYPEGI